jgi:hypothetical protein
MKPFNAPSVAAPAIDAAPALSPDSPAVARLSDSRERMAAWLAADRAHRARPSLGGWAASAVWPVIKGLREHPSASLALGALAQGLLRPATPSGDAHTLPAIPPMLDQGLALVRRHPKTAVAVVAAAGAVWLWIRSSHPRSPQR